MTYGRPDINAVLDRLRERLGLPLDGSVAEQRRYGKMLIDKMRRDYPLRDPLETSLQLIDITFTPSKELEFHARNATSPKYIYWNASKIIAAWKHSRRGAGNQKLRILESIARESKDARDDNG